MSRRERHAALVAACQLAAPECVEPLWVTITHAPDNVLADVAALLVREVPCVDARLRALLGWYGHGGGDCPICWMLTGRLVFTVPEPIAGLGRALVEAPAPELLSGAALFLSSQLEPRHALPAGVDRARLGVLLDEVRALPGTTQELLLGHWESTGGDRERLARRF